MANLRDPGLPSNLQALESSRDILKRQIKDLEKSVTFLEELRLDLEAVEKAINALTGRVVFPDEEPIVFEGVNNVWTAEKR
jgi:prefoldin subunit 5